MSWFDRLKQQYRLGVNRAQCEALLKVLPLPQSWSVRRQDLGRVWCQGMSRDADVRMSLDHKGRIIFYSESVEPTAYRRQYERVEALSESSFYFYRDGTAAVDSRSPIVPLTRILKKRRAVALAAHRKEFGATS